MSASNYLRLCLTGTLSLLLLSMAFNYVMDPYGIYHGSKSWDWIRNRPAIADNDFLEKAYAVRQLKPDLLILGSSRVAMGMDPSHGDLPANSYNLGLMGSNIYTAWRYTQHASSIHVPQVIILGIDFEYFSSELHTMSRMALR